MRQRKKTGAAFRRPGLWDFLFAALRVFQCNVNVAAVSVYQQEYGIGWLDFGDDLFIIFYPFYGFVIHFLNDIVFQYKPVCRTFLTDIVYKHAYRTGG